MSHVKVDCYLLHTKLCNQQKPRTVRDRCTMTVVHRDEDWECPFSWTTTQRTSWDLVQETY
ncbi:hypothetical protein J6590_047497 [Homalodisca vitripennis]|nr:hypothetical protein J6590_047497 [Homalodisca vitripennis]